MKYQGLFNNSTSYPTGTIYKGYTYLLQNNSTIGDKTVTSNSYLIALVDNPGTINSNWTVITNSYIAENLANRNQPNGYPGLDNSSKILISQMPISGLSYKGTWNASINNPTIPTASPISGDYFKVSVIGSTNIGGITDWGLGDWIIYNGSIWDKIDNSDQVSSVNSKVGTVVLSAADVSAVPLTRTINTKPLSSDITLTSTDIGLGNVNNTSDLNKPISTAVATQLNNLGLVYCDRISYVNTSVTTFSGASPTEVSYVNGFSTSDSTIIFPNQFINIKSLISTLTTNGTTGLGLKFLGNTQPIDIWFSTVLQRQTLSNESGGLVSGDVLTLNVYLDDTLIRFYDFTVPSSTVTAITYISGSGYDPTPITGTTFTGTNSGVNGVLFADSNYGGGAFRGPSLIENYPDGKLLFAARTSAWNVTVYYQTTGNNFEVSESIGHNEMLVLMLGYYYNASNIRTRGWIRLVKVTYANSYTSREFNLDASIDFRMLLRKNDYYSLYKTQKLQISATLKRNTSDRTPMVLNGFKLQLIYGPNSHAIPTYRPILSNSNDLAVWFSFNRTLVDEIRGYVMFNPNNLNGQWAQISDTNPSIDNSLVGTTQWALRPNGNIYSIYNGTYLTKNNLPPLILGSSYTMSFWFYMANVQWVNFFSIGFAEGNGFNLSTNQFVNGLITNFTGGWNNFGFVPNTWTLCTFRTNSVNNNQDILFNGATLQISLPSYKGTIQTLNIGAGNANYLVRDFKIWNRALTDAQLITEYNNGLLSTNYINI